MIRTYDCITHKGAKKRLFCREDKCWMHICQFCYEEGHQGHNVISIPDLINEVASIKEGIAKSWQTHANDLKNMLKQLDLFDERTEKKHNLIITEGEKVKSKVEQQIKRIETCILAEKQELEKKIKKIAKRIETNNKLTIEESSKIIKKFESLIKDGTADEIRAVFEFVNKASISKTEEDLKVQFHDEIETLAKEIESFEFLDDLFNPGFGQTNQESMEVPVYSRFSPSPSRKNLEISQSPTSKTRNFLSSLPETPVTLRSQANLLASIPSTKGIDAKKSKKKNDKLQNEIYKKNEELRKLDRTIEMKKSY